MHHELRATENGKTELTMANTYYNLFQKLRKDLSNKRTLYRTRQCTKKFQKIYCPYITQSVKNNYIWKPSFLMMEFKDRTTHLSVLLCSICPSLYNMSLNNGPAKRINKIIIFYLHLNKHDHTIQYTSPLHQFTEEIHPQNKQTTSSYIFVT